MFLIQSTLIFSSNINDVDKALGREKNYYEIIGFNKTKVGAGELEKQYEEMNKKYNPAFNSDPENLVRFKTIKEAYECIKTFSCRAQYKKFGSYIASLVTIPTGGESKLSTKEQMESLDPRMFASVAFYFSFSLLAAALTTPEQKNGLRYALSLAVVFCMSEIEWLADETREDDLKKSFSVVELFP